MNGELKKQKRLLNRQKAKIVYLAAWESSLYARSKTQTTSKDEPKSKYKLINSIAAANTNSKSLSTLSSVTRLQTAQQMIESVIRLLEK